MTEPDQCIICLESLQPPSSQLDGANGAGPTVATTGTTSKATYQRIDSDIEILEEDENNHIATLVGCNHVVHDRCIRSWAKNSNTCPICRTPFNEVSLSSELNGPPVDSYAVQDKKQEQEFDIHRWLEENPEDDASEPSPICPICESGDHEDVLLLCDGCNAAYHTHCIGLAGVPQTEYWFCFECTENNTGHSRPGDISQADLQEAQAISQAIAQAARPSNRRSVYARRGFLRTQLQARNARREARSLEWQGAWDRIASRIYDATDIDLDNHEEDDAFQSFRRVQSQREQREQIRDLQEHRDWEQRMSIASRMGARDVFVRNIRPTVGHRLDGLPVEPVQPPPPPPAPETRDEQRAWGALERARDTETTPNTRKRKSRSVTASPQEPAQEPERKLKRPRTRRLPLQGEASASGSGSGSVPVPVPVPVSASASASASASTSTSASALASASASAPTSVPTATSSPAPTTAPASRQTNHPARRPQSPIGTETGPSFLSSLLKEVEMSTPSDDDAMRNYFGTRSGIDPSSPVTSPSPSSRNSPRALSLTPPPHPRPSSPTLSLSSYVEPRFPKANYSPTRASGDSSDSDSRSNGAEIRQPRPQRPMRHRANLTRSQDSSPTRSAISLENKERISNIVRAALNPHYRAKGLTTEQYATINRDVSRKLYEGLRDPLALDEDAKKAWEKIAAREVARAVEELKA
ncbi:PHD-finger domain-containing protein [Colletotrichum truncatum]|uniref:PHD-finger domain-containing protein n=1 Tax=Colletotrichum truncatum TaxID=5467 RepID=A0ACC3YJB7_COLTU|nr:PHD-finger domain-containing protein [Colletotrichum truncatum]KAF6797244.1 PHD-finger domain-containing protein [Colletotrichum truncatum]